MTPDALPAQWRALADTLRPYNGGAAEAYERAARELEAAQASTEGEGLSLEAAAEISSYSADHLGRMVREGRIPNVGRPNAPRIARRDLPRKVRRGSRQTGSGANSLELVREAVNSKLNRG